MGVVTREDLAELVGVTDRLDQINVRDLVCYIAGSIVVYLDAAVTLFRRKSVAAIRARVLLKLERRLRAAFKMCQHVVLDAHDC